ncbi:MAG TPA: hypothetical protein VL633_10885 [Bacteroidota bacterium]|nr:hypothetical protein [Bacteroidota bacterium]
MFRVTVAVTCLLVLVRGGLRAQEFVLEDNLTGTENGIVDSVQSGQASNVQRLLPANISWMEKGLWGEFGILRKIGIASTLTPETRKSELALRRTMLTAHQIGGFVTLGLLGATVYYGQRTLDEGDPRGLRSIHSNLVTASIITYSLTGLLAVLSPPPLIRRDEVSTTTIHKLLAWVHFAGMVVTPIIGASLHNSMSYDQLVRFHQISGYITASALAASLIVVTF